MTQNTLKMKRAYEKPSMKVYQLQNNQPQLLAGSSLPLNDPSNPSPYQW